MSKKVSFCGSICTQFCLGDHITLACVVKGSLIDHDELQFCMFGLSGCIWTQLCLCSINFVCRGHFEFHLECVTELSGFAGLL